MGWSGKTIGNAGECQGQAELSTNWCAQDLKLGGDQPANTRVNCAIPDEAVAPTRTHKTPGVGEHGGSTARATLLGNTPTGEHESWDLVRTSMHTAVTPIGLHMNRFRGKSRMGSVTISTDG